MFLVDTSIWIDHLRTGDAALMVYLEAGYVDAHLLAAAILTVGARLWTRDKQLDVVADRLGLGLKTLRDSNG